VVVEAVVAEVDMGGTLVDDGSEVFGSTVDMAELAYKVCSVLHLIGIVPPSLIHRAPANRTPATNKLRSKPQLHIRRTCE
jgi:hypothetical protein